MSTPVACTDKNLCRFLENWINCEDLYDKRLIYIILKYCNDHLRNFHYGSECMDICYFTQNIAFVAAKNDGCVIFGPGLHEIISKTSGYNICVSLNIIETKNDILEFGLISTNTETIKQTTQDIERCGLSKIILNDKGQNSYTINFGKNVTTLGDGDCQLFAESFGKKIILKKKDKINCLINLFNDSIDLCFTLNGKFIKSFDLFEKIPTYSPTFTIKKNQKQWNLALFLGNGFVVGTRVIIIKK